MYDDTTQTHVNYTHDKVKNRVKRDSSDVRLDATVGGRPAREGLRLRCT